MNYMKDVKTIVLCGFGMALTFVLTAFIAIPIGQFGYINLGDLSVMLFASILSPSLAFLVGGIGSALADLYLGYSQYALFTLLIKGIEGFLVAYLFSNLKSKKILAYIVSVPIVALGYCLADTILLQSFITAASGIPFNVLQSGASMALAMIASKVFIKQATLNFLHK